MYHLELRPMRRAASLFSDHVWDKEVEKLLNALPKTEGSVPATEVLHAEKDYFIRLDVPGVMQEDIEIEVEDNHLVISG